jgi:hypothetical protein
MNTILSNLIDNDIIVYSLCTVTICLITGFYIKSYVNLYAINPTVVVNKP